jgi:hypothetical protein
MAAATVLINLPLPPGDPAVRSLNHPVPAVSVFESGGISPATLEAVAETAWRRNARLAVIHQGTLRMMWVRRGEETVQEAASGYGFPMTTVAIDPGSARFVNGGEVASELAVGRAVMSTRSAALRGARTGDRILLEGWNGELVELEIGVLVDDEEIDWVELVIAEADAARLGLVRPARLLVWGVDDLVALAATTRAAVPDGPIRVSLPGDPSPEDWVLPTVAVKERFGEFSFRRGVGDSIIIDRGWLERWIVEIELPLIGRLRCHRLVIPYLRGALREIEAAGLDGLIDLDDTQAAGGCFNARLMRGGDRGFALSRHAWGAAVDLNPTSNPYGGEVVLPESVGNILRRWGFSWGAGWLVPDGMHFEWRSFPEDLPDLCPHLGLSPPGGALGLWTVYARNRSCPEE